jgi:hypothetical protein
VLTCLIRLAAALLVLSGAALAQSHAVEIVSGSIIDRPFSALRDGRSVDIESRTLQLRFIDRLEEAVVYELALFRAPLRATRR